MGKLSRTELEEQVASLDESIKQITLKQSELIKKIEDSNTFKFSDEFRNTLIFSKTKSPYKSDLLLAAIRNGEKYTTIILSRSIALELVEFLNNQLERD